MHSSKYKKDLQNPSDSLHLSKVSKLALCRFVSKEVSKLLGRWQLLGLHCAWPIAAALVKFSKRNVTPELPEVKGLKSANATRMPLPVSHSTNSEWVNTFRSLSEVFELL